MDPIMLRDFQFLGRAIKMFLCFLSKKNSVLKHVTASERSSLAFMLEC